jgi:hypothetical protein
MLHAVLTSSSCTPDCTEVGGRIYHDCGAPTPIPASEVSSTVGALILEIVSLRQQLALRTELEEAGTRLIRVMGPRMTKMREYKSTLQAITGLRGASEDAELLAQTAIELAEGALTTHQ